MSERSYDEFETEESLRLQDELPPVRPPSAGFIVQLFVVPALIVLAVIGVWVLFGKLAAGEQDWRALVADMHGDNVHRRDRAAAALAHMLRNDEQPGSGSQQLHRNREVATELAGLFEERLKERSTDPADLSQQAFLARTLGFLDVPDVVLPVLQEGMRDKHDRDIRKNAIAGVALIAGRSAERGRPLDEPKLLDELIEVSSDSDPLVRQLSAFTLGLIATPRTRDRLLVMLNDGDADTRLNAALGLARQDSTAGVPQFKVVLASANEVPAEIHASAEASAERKQEAETQAFERAVAVKNTLKAVDDLSSKLTAREQTEFLALVRPISENHAEARIRLDAGHLVRKLQQTAP